MAKKLKRSPQVLLLRQPEGDVSPARRVLLEWVHAAFKRKQLAIAEHVLVTSPRGVDAYSGATTLQGVGPEGLRQAAAILTRDAGDDELVAVLEHIVVVGVSVGPRDGAAGGMLLLARSKNGESFAQSWKVTGPGRLERVDREAAGTAGGRSGVVERWLRRAAAADVERDIDDATAAYYASLRGGPGTEDEAIARASSSAARRVHHGDAPRPRAR